MKTLTKSLFAVAMVLVISAPVYAGHNERGGDVRDRLERQHSRIEHGIDSGKLTRKEAKVLKRQQRETRHLYRDFRDDGRLTKHERRKLDRQLDRNSDRIWDLKHNARSRHFKSDYRYGYEWHDRDGWPRHHHHHKSGWYW